MKMDEMKKIPEKEYEYDEDDAPAFPDDCDEGAACGKPDDRDVCDDCGDCEDCEGCEGCEDCEGCEGCEGCREPADLDDYDEGAEYGWLDNYELQRIFEPYDESIDYGTYRTHGETREDRNRRLEESDDEYDEDGSSIIERRMMGIDYDEIAEERMLESDGYVDLEAQNCYEPEPDVPDTFMNGVALTTDELLRLENLPDPDDWVDTDPSDVAPDDLGF